MVFQAPFASLNPRTRIGKIIAQGPMMYGASAKEAKNGTLELLDIVGLGPRAHDRFPHEFSGGQRQRIGIARILALEPEILMADEPVSALDVSIQAQILTLLDEIRDRMNLSMIFITHDLRVAAQVCDRIAVMQRGKVIEVGPTWTMFANPVETYTRELLAAVPGKDQDRRIRPWGMGHKPKDGHAAQPLGCGGASGSGGLVRGHGRRNGRGFDGLRCRDRHRAIGAPARWVLWNCGP